MEKTLRVTGRGILSVAPDQIRLSMTLGGVCPDYPAAVRTSAEKTDALQTCFAAAGFPAEELRTSRFGVQAEYESFQDEKGNYRQRFTGYRFEHVLTLRFDADDALLGRALGALAAAGADPEFEIAYTVRDPEAAKATLLAAAVRDSPRKAQLLADAAGVTLGPIVSIDYSWGDMEILARPVNRMPLCKAESASDSIRLNIHPENIELNDTVTVVWSI